MAACSQWREMRIADFPGRTDLCQEFHHPRERRQWRGWTERNVANRNRAQSALAGDRSIEGHQSVIGHACPDSKIKRWVHAKPKRTTLALPGSLPHRSFYLGDLEELGLTECLSFHSLCLGFIALAGGFQSISLSILRLYNYLLRREAMANTGLKGTTHWATKKDLKGAGLYDTQGVFLGCDTTGHPIFFDGETHGLTLAPAGSGKTVAFTIPALCHSPLPIIAIDYKGVLSVMTKDLRRRNTSRKPFV